MKTVIALSGYTKSGKDTVADILVNKHGYQKIAFADSTYEEVSKSFGVPISFLKNRVTKTEPNNKLSVYKCDNLEYKKLMLLLGYDIESPRTSRTILQTWGTEFRRGYNKDYWIDRVKEKIEQSKCNKIVIPDLRFDNEIEYCYNISAKFVLVRRDGCNPINDHLSENVIPEEMAYEVIGNNGSLDNLEQKVLRLVSNISYKDQHNVKELD